MLKKFFIPSAHLMGTRIRNVKPHPSKRKYLEAKAGLIYDDNYNGAIFFNNH